jgi:flagellar motor switch/type III secretory pathway protein FliN
MSALRPEIAPDVVSQCQMAAGEVGQAFSRAFGYTVEATVAGPESLIYSRMGQELAASGLAMLFYVGESAAAILIPKTGGLLPSWYSSSEAEAEGKFTTLAQELGMLVLPETFISDRQQVFQVPQLGAALRAGGAVDGTAVVRLSLTADGKQTSALMVWPLPNAQSIAEAVHGMEAIAGENAAAPDREQGHESHAGQVADGSVTDHAGSTSAHSQSETDGGVDHAERGPSLRDLPTYTRSLLKIRVPLSVTLAAKKQPVGQILEIGPGSILQFEKSCEEMLDLNVSNLPIAQGEAVKVGEKFGLRVTSLILPGERFKALVAPRPEQVV